MKTKDALLAMMGVLTFFAGLPISFIMQYQLYSHVQAPQIVWTLFFIQMPILIFCTILKTIADRIEE